MNRLAPSPNPESRAASAAFVHLEPPYGKSSRPHPRMCFINLRFMQRRLTARRPLAPPGATAYLRANSANR
jgi:hypothetical protein